MNDVTARHAMPHEEAEMLLPFLANGSLDDDERVRVEGHARACLPCRKALAEERALVEAFRADGLPAQVAADTLARVLGEVRQAGGKAAPAIHPRVAARSRWQAQAPRFALAAALLLAIGVAWQSSMQQAEAPADFRTLSRAGEQGVAHGTVFVVFEPSVPVATISRLLREVGGEVVAGPNSVGAYTLRAPGEVGNVVAALQAAPEVSFVAPASELSDKEQPQ